MRTQAQQTWKILLWHRGRNTLATVLVSFSTLGVLGAAGLIIIGTILHLSVGPYRVILDDYDGAYLSLILGALGFTGIIMHCLLIFLLVDFTNSERAEHFGRVCVALVVCAGCTVAAGIMCFAHILEINSSFRNGLSSGMKNYRV